jgi:Leucine-rich repeat (LRR) protein
MKTVAKCLIILLALPVSCSPGAPPASPGAEPAPAPDGAVPEYVTICGEQYSTSLTSLDLDSYSHFSENDMKSLRHMKNLTELNLDECLSGKTDLSPLASLADLRVLHLIYNQIEDVAPLASLASLIELRLDGNPVEDFPRLKPWSATTPPGKRDKRAL